MRLCAQECRLQCIENLVAWLQQRLEPGGVIFPLSCAGWHFAMPVRPCQQKVPLYTYGGMLVGQGGAV